MATNPTRSTIVRKLAAADLPASKVTAHRDGSFTIAFNDPNRSNFYSRGTQPARIWAQRIQEAMPLADVINVHDSIADWRPTWPVLTAFVVIAFPAQMKSTRQTMVAQQAL